MIYMYTFYILFVFEFSVVSKSTSNCSHCTRQLSCALCSFCHRKYRYNNRDLKPKHTFSHSSTEHARRKKKPYLHTYAFAGERRSMNSARRHTLNSWNSFIVLCVERPMLGARFDSKNIAQNENTDAAVPFNTISAWNQKWCCCRRCWFRSKQWCVRRPEKKNAEKHKMKSDETHKHTPKCTAAPTSAKGRLNDVRQKKKPIEDLFEYMINRWR